MPITNITTLPTPPSRSDPSNFASRADAFLGALPTFVTELNIAGNEIETAEANAEDAATAAAASAAAASVTANAGAWVSGFSYAQYANAIDPTDFKTYRRKTAGSSTTEPHLDGTNWELLAGQGDMTLSSVQTVTGAKTFTSPVVVPSGASGTQVPQAQEVALLSTFATGMRNRLINGGMDFAHRGASFPAVADNTYTLDRWLANKTSSAVFTVEQSADVPSIEFTRSLRVTVTTADASIAAGDYAFITQRVEGQHIRGLFGVPVALSFWVRSSKTGIHCVSFRNTAYDRTFVGQYTIAAANTWEKHSILLPTGIANVGTWNIENGMGLDVSWALAVGSTFQSTANTWQAGNFLGTSSQVNCLDTNGNIFAITGCQLEAAAVATPFEHRSQAVERLLCYRYARLSTTLTGWTITTTNATFGYIFDTPMRTTPSATVVNSTSVVLDPQVAQRNLTSISGLSGDNRGGYFDAVIPASTANKMHLLILGAILFTAEL